MKMKQRGFTIVELLIVIVVIAILAAIVIVAYNSIQQRARVSKANTDLATLGKAIVVGRISQDKILGQITGNFWTDGGDQALYQQSLDRISTASGADLTALKAGDPWGNKYIIDENEGETPGCHQDTIGSHSNQIGVNNYIVIPSYNC